MAPQPRQLLMQFVYAGVHVRPLQVSLTEGDALFDQKLAFLKEAERRESETFPLYADRCGHAGCLIRLGGRGP